ncbi:hypothetical protein VTN77DRAFT_7217 [Rasamsonia byssochlamydoides]|uniref:uncharacterized protein n=1 Tax=Rasamsonia byssochlamydoides TaxID=89139 RepID=UPI003743E0F8
MPLTASDICKIIAAIILPPLGVFLERGCGADLLINICLTILGYIPGIIHALYGHDADGSAGTLSSSTRRLTKRRYYSMGNAISYRKSHALTSGYRGRGPPSHPCLCQHGLMLTAFG